MTFCTSRGSVVTLYRWGGQIYNLLVCNSLTKNRRNRMVFDVTLTSQPSWKLKSAFVQLQNLFFKFKFLSFWRTSSKYGMKHQIYKQLCVELKSKIWCKNIHAFLRNCYFRVEAFYFDAPCIVSLKSNQKDQCFKNCVRHWIHYTKRMRTSMGADLCSTLGILGSCKGDPWVLPPENFGNFICQTVHFGEYLCDWSTEIGVHFVVLNSECWCWGVLINFLTKQLG